MLSVLESLDIVGAGAKGISHMGQVRLCITIFNGRIVYLTLPAGLVCALSAGRRFTSALLSILDKGLPPRRLKRPSDEQ